MDKLKDVLPCNMLDIIERAGISTTKQIILLSIWDIKKLTNLSIDDIKMIKNIVCESVSPASTTSEKLVQKGSHNNRISTGCLVINELLKGGFRRGTATEVYGESGSGKTQLALQAAASNWSTGCVYICTEDLFPIKRFEQIKRSISDYSSTIDYGNNIFVEHVTEGHELLSCIRVRLPKLLEKKNVSLVVIDSVAAPFRSEYTNYIQRAEDLRELAMALISVAQRYQLAVLCINQVTASFTNSDSVLPSLGLAWSNIVPTRLGLRKLRDMVTVKSEDGTCEGNIREIYVNFAPDLPNSVAKFTISKNGIIGL